MERESVEKFEMLKESRYELLRQSLINERNNVGLKQADVANKLDKPQSYVSKIERGERKVDVVEFVELAEAIGFNPHLIIQKLVEITAV